MKNVNEIAIVARKVEHFSAAAADAKSESDAEIYAAAAADAEIYSDMKNLEELAKELGVEVIRSEWARKNWKRCYYIRKNGDHIHPGMLDEDELITELRRMMRGRLGTGARRYCAQAGYDRDIASRKIRVAQLKADADLALFLRNDRRDNE